MKNRTLVVPLLSLSALTGCGKFLDNFSRLPKPGYTTVQTQGTTRSARFGSRAQTPFDGGMLIYAHGHADGLPAPQTFTFHFPDDGGPNGHNFRIPNGTYEFFVIGYTAANLGGAPRCGRTQDATGSPAPVALTGGNVPIVLDTTADNCSTGDFSSPDFATASGHAVRELKLSFCAGSSPLNTVTGNCQNGNESSRFFAGASGSGYTGVGTEGNMHYNEATHRFVYAADPHAPGRQELYSVTEAGKATVMQNHPYLNMDANGTKIKRVRSAPNVIATTAGFVAFTLSEGPNFDKVDLYLTRAGAPGDVKVNPTITCSSTCSPNAGGVTDFQFTPDGRYLVFLADNVLGGSGVSSGLNAYSVDLTTVSIGGSAPTLIQLNSASTPIFRPSGGGQDGPRLVMSQTAPYPVLFAEAGLGGSRVELFMNKAAGGARVSVGAKHAIVGSNTSSALDTPQYDFNFDGSKIVWIDTASDVYPSVHDYGVLLSCSVSASGAPCSTATEVTDPTRLSAFGGASSFMLSPVGDIAMLASDAANATPRVFDFYSIDLGTNAATKVFANTTTNRNGFFEEGRFSPVVGGVQYFAFFKNENDCSDPPTCSSPNAAFRLLHTVRIGAANSRANHSRRPDTTATLSNGLTQWFNNTHVLQNGDKVRLTTDGTLPTPFDTVTDYFVVARTTNGFSLSLTQGGAGIASTSAGSGTHTIVPQDSAIFHMAAFGVSGTHDDVAFLTDSSNVQHLLFLTDGGNDGTLGAANVKRLFDAIPGVPSAVDTTATAFTNHPPANVTVNSLSVHDTRAFLSADSPRDVFTYTVGTTAASRWRALQLNKANYPAGQDQIFPDHVEEVFVPGGPGRDITLSDGAFFGIVKGYADGTANTPLDVWLVRNLGSAATPSPLKLSRMKQGGPLGHFEVSLLGYQTDPEGHIIPSSVFPALTTGCQAGSSSSDGTLLAPGIHIPGSQECDANGNCPFTPFLIGLDVFGDSESCDGQPSRRILSGFQGMQNPTASSEFKLVPFSGNELKLFVRD